jgi:tRNA threonylcarbamoyladenosine biosynthesis protein TsaB
MGYLLAIETATTTARVALLDGAGARRAAREATAERHSSNLLRLCDEVLREAGIAPAALDAIACGAGPGSFTGLRVGLAVGKGLALPTSTPFVLVSSLRALALDILAADDGAPGPDGVPDGGAIACACIDAGKGQVYVGLFRADPQALVQAISDEWVLDPGELAARAPAQGRLMVAGNGALRYAAIVDGALAARGGGARRVEVAGPSADAVGRLALLRLGRGESDDLATAVPAYGRPPDITRPKRP